VGKRGLSSCYMTSFPHVEALQTHVFPLSRSPTSEYALQRGITGDNVAHMRSLKIDGPALKRAREMAGYTQEQVASRIGVDRSTVGHWESTKRPDQPSAPRFKLLCRVLKVERESLLVAPHDRAA
jgi:DNA-binding XRE family transcriptional regulator